MYRGVTMTLRHLMIFIKVYEQKSITKAANQLHLAQPAVSLVIKEIENHYQITLFDRMNRKIYPTFHADRLYEYAISIVDLFEQMEKEMENCKENGVIKIGSSITNSHYVLPNVIKSLQDHYPELKIITYVNNTKVLEKQILENKLDIAIIESQPESNNVIKIPFMTDYLTVIASKDHQLLNKNNIDLSTLVKYPFFTREKGSSVNTLLKSVFQTKQIPINFAMESISSQAIIKNVEYGLGIACLPYMLVKSALKQGSIKEVIVPDLQIKRQYHAIYHYRKNVSTIINDFINICIEFGKYHQDLKQ